MLIVKRLALGALVVVASAVIAWYLVFGSNITPATSAQPTIPAVFRGNPVAGGAFLYAKSCSTCHGPAGQGSDTVPIRLNSQTVRKDFSLQSMTEYIQYNMPANSPGLLNHADASALAAFIYSLGKKG